MMEEERERELADMKHHRQTQYVPSLAYVSYLTCHPGIKTRLQEEGWTKKDYGAF